MQQIDLEQARRTNWVLWASLLLVQVVYVGILVSGLLPPRPEPPPATFALVLGVSAVGIAIFAHVCWRRSRGAGRAVHEPPPTQQAAFTSFLLACVLDESIGVFGLALGYLGAPMETWAPFIAAAVALLLIHRPA
jgi:hypothetical protein